MPVHLERVGGIGLVALLYGLFCETGELLIRLRQDNIVYVEMDHRLNISDC